jgi:hypothetical protein
MFLTADDFMIAQGHTARSEDLRARMDRLCQTVLERVAQNPVLGDLVLDRYVGTNTDPTNQWFCLLPARQHRDVGGRTDGFADVKTMFVHFHCVLPQSENYGNLAWMGLNAEFDMQRRALRDVLASAPQRARVLEELKQLKDAAVWVAEKWTLEATAQVYDWRPRTEAQVTKGPDVSDEFLVDLGRRLGEPPATASDPRYLVHPAVVIGWFVPPATMVDWGRRFPDELMKCLERAAPLWKLLARGGEGR